jgi:predicted glycosyltransferase
MTDAEYTLSITKEAELRIRRMIRWRFWIRKPAVMLVEKIPRGAPMQTEQEIYEYYHLRWSSKYLVLMITSVDKFSAETRETFFMNVGGLTVSPHHKMVISGKKDWVLDFVNNKFILKVEGEKMG